METLSLKMKNSQQPGSRTRSVGFGSSSSKFGLYKIQQQAKKVCLSIWDRLCLPKTLFYFDMIDAHSWLQIKENQSKAIGVFLLAWPKDTPITPWPLLV